MNHEYFDTIHRYLTDAMTADERAAFEADLRDNDQLRRDVDTERLLIEGLARTGAEISLQETLGETQEKLRAEGFFERKESAAAPQLEIIHSSTNSSSTMKRILALAAAVAVLLAGIWFFTSRNATPAANPDALFAKYYNADRAKAQARKDAAALESHGLAGASTAADTLGQSIQLYADGKFEDCINMLKPYLAAHPNDEMAQYYVALSHLAQSRYAKAIEMLSPLSTSGTFLLKNDAKWYLGLCYLKAESGVDEARQVFESIANDPDPANLDHDAAKAILEQIMRK